VFCATAVMPYTRSLSAAEMLVQFLVARAGAAAETPVRNVVFMGMGEPMDNLDQVLAAVDRLTQQPAPRLAAAHVTVSTSGIVPGMRRFLAESRALLALSLNATTDEQRAELMPQARRWPIAELLDVLRAAGRPVFVEYVLFDGVNDRDEDARRLPALLDGVLAHVNLIPHNPVHGSPLRPPPVERVRRFQRLVQAGGLRCLVRWPRGGDVAAACGQLVRLGRDAVAGDGPVDRGGTAARLPDGGIERETNSA
jgi:23S rRNA (adenine2503-C2)-methyltransferase